LVSFLKITLYKTAMMSGIQAIADANLPAKRLGAVSLIKQGSATDKNTSFYNEW